ncbi:MAG TPA: hypothetical protein VEI29_03250 [Burkholderiaceae bacterium]|nr:hypothetical protein [Burkholderiaceae bacterium]
MRPTKLCARAWVAPALFAGARNVLRQQREDKWRIFSNDIHRLGVCAMHMGQGVDFAC